MTDFVLDQNKKLKNAPDAFDAYCRMVDYAKFLQQPLKLEMFIPVDEEEKVLFEGFEKCDRNSNVICVYHIESDCHLNYIFDKGHTIEKITGWDISLTASAIKLLGFTK